MNISKVAEQWIGVGWFLLTPPGVLCLVFVVGFLFFFRWVIGT